MADLDPAQVAASLGGIAGRPADTNAAQDPDAVAASLGGIRAQPEPGQPSSPSQGPAPKAPTATDHPSGLAGAALAGLKQTLAPFSLTKQELDGPKTGAETAVEIGSNLASDVALPAAAGALAAGAVSFGLLAPEGAMLGAASGALVHVALAAYRGFGYEYAKSKADGQAFDPVRGLVNTAAQINPLVAKGGRLFAAGRQAALEFASQYQYSHDADSAGIAGAAGAVIAGLTHRNTGEWLAHIGTQAGRPGSKTERAGMTPYEMQGALIATDDSTYGLGTKTDAAIAELTKQNADHFTLGPQLKKLYDAQLDGAPAELKSDVRGFGNWLIDQPGAGAEDANTGLRQYKRKFGDDALDKAYGIYKRQEVQNGIVEQLNAQMELDILGKDEFGNLVTGPSTAVVDDYGNRVSKGKADQVVDDYGNVVPKNGSVGTPSDPVGGIGDKLRDIKFVMHKIDDVLGTNFEGMVMNFSGAKNKANNIAVTYITQANKLQTAARKLGMDPEQIGRYLAEDDTNKGRAMIAGMGGPSVAPQKITWTAEEQQVVDGWRNWFEQVRTRLGNEGLSIDFLDQGSFAAGDRYLPMRSKSGPEAAAAIRGEVRRLQDMHGSDYLTTADSSELRRSVAKILNNIEGTDIEPEQVVYRNQVEKAINAAVQPNSKAAMGFSGGMSFQREVGLPAPEFIRDYDVGKLALGYLNNGLKSTIYNDPMMQMNAQLETLRGMGFHRSADYLERYMRDVSGQSNNLVSTITYAANRYKDTLNRLIEDSDGGLKTSALKVARYAPDFASFALSSIYPNFLGGNIRAVLRDFTKPFLLTAPELGWGYGLKVVGRAIMGAAWDKAKNGLNMEHELQSRNLAPARNLGVMGDLTDSGIRGTKYLGGAVELTEKANNLSMWMYAETDKMNRYIQLRVGHELANDVQAGDRRAIAYVQRTLSEGNKSELRELGDLRTADPQKLGDLLGRQLVSKTSFDYGKEGMNEFGRSMGRMFSMFTKWPAMMMSDAAEHFQQNGLWGGIAKNATRYVAPMAAMMFATQYILDTDNNPYQRFLIGKNLAEWAPAASWTIGTPPLLQTAQQFSDTFFHKMFDPDKTGEQKLGELGKFATRNVLTYLPGSQFYNEYQRANRAFHPEDYK